MRTTREGKVVDEVGTPLLSYIWTSLALLLLFHQAQQSLDHDAAQVPLVYNNAAASADLGDHLAEISCRCQMEASEKRVLSRRRKGRENDHNTDRGHD